MDNDKIKLENRLVRIKNRGKWTKCGGVKRKIERQLGKMKTQESVNE